MVMKRKAWLSRPKTPEEIKNIKKAVDISRKVFLEIMPFGKTEKEVAGEIRKSILKHGARPSFKPIVASGKGSVTVHHKPGRRIIRDSQPLIIDLGAKFRGQCADITRMYIPDRRAGKIYSCVKNMQKACIRKLKPGISFSDINELYMAMMKKKGYKVMHGIGHGLGFHIHERIETLSPGIVLTIEPGVYIKNYAGFRIEDVVLIKRNCVEVLSASIPQVLRFPVL